MNKEMLIGFFIGFLACYTSDWWTEARRLKRLQKWLENDEELSREYFGVKKHR